MSTVVVFPAEKVQSASRLDHGPAQVFIFTGVRYERLEYVPPPMQRTSARTFAKTSKEAPFQG